MQSQHNIDKAQAPKKKTRRLNKWILPALGAAFALIVAVSAVSVLLYGVNPRSASADRLQEIAPAIETIILVKPTVNVRPMPMPPPAPQRLAAVKPTVVPTVAAREVFKVSQSAEVKLPPANIDCPVPTGTIVTETIDSNVTVLPITVHIYLPPCYNAQEYEYPALYLIHGTEFEQGGFIENGLPRLAELQMGVGTLPPFIIVMPGADMRAGDASKYSWTNWGDGSYSDFFVNELVPFVDSKYSTWKRKEGRAIGGISRGGYWSVQIGFSHPELFSAVGGHSPSTGTMLVNMPAGFTMIQTAKSIEDLRTLRIWLDAGGDDWARVDAKNLAAELDENNVSYSLSIGQGIHEDAYWISRFTDYLNFYAQDWPRMARARQAIGMSQP
jgi:enterochelin esterase-like enzyme